MCLVRGIVVSDDHAFGISATHVGFDVIDRNTIAASDCVSLFDDATTGNLVTDFRAFRVWSAGGKLDEFLPIGGNRDPLVPLKNLYKFLRYVELAIVDGYRSGHGLPLLLLLDVVCACS
jgi:hypothetical protein